MSLLCRYVRLLHLQALQSVHTLATRSEEKVPIGQTKQLELEISPCKVLYLPAQQPVHTA